MGHLDIRPLTGRDIPEIVAAFVALGWNKPAAQYERYLDEQGRGEREVLVAFDGDAFAGYLTVVWQSATSRFDQQISRRLSISTCCRIYGGEELGRV